MTSSVLYFAGMKDEPYQPSRAVRKYYSHIGKRGAEKLKEKYGDGYFALIRQGKRPSELAKKIKDVDFKK